jgi:hypothetical protein
LGISGEPLPLRDRLYNLIGVIHSVVVRIGGRLGWLFDRSLGKLPMPGQFSLLAGLAALVCFTLGLRGELLLANAAQFGDRELEALDKTGFLSTFHALLLLFIGCGVLNLIAAGAAWVRKRWSFLILKMGSTYFTVLWILLLYNILRGPGDLLEAEVISRFVRNELRLAAIALWLPGTILAFFYVLCVLRKMAGWTYLGGPGGYAWCDRTLADIRSGGEDPRYRSSTRWSGFLHVFCIVILPVLLRGCGWEAPYHIPPGSGQEAVQMQIKSVKKKVEQQKLILSMNTDILFYRPDPDESDILRETEIETENQYEAQGVEGKLGQGGGTRGGWPNAMPGRVRFLRLEYAGGDWDQDMGTGADYNMLIKFREMTSYAIARNTEHIKIHRLKFFPEGRAPPFVFITGKGGVNMSSAEMKVLRNYCLREGGMIFADNGGGSFNGAFRGAMRRVFPDKNWITISNDDPIFRYPYVFPNGAPPLWHHSGRKAVGLRHEGRWICFYHQGDINDAWKSNHSGIDEGLANQAYKMGINVMYYAFTRYLAEHKDKTP